MSTTNRQIYKDYEGVLSLGEVTMMIKNQTITTCGTKDYLFRSVYNSDRSMLEVEDQNGKIPKHIDRSKRKKTRKIRNWK